jgi:hypothetical protein
MSPDYSGMQKPFVLALGLSASACVTPIDDPEVGTDVAAIHDGGVAANAYQLARAIKIPGCTATRIAPRHAITASHCVPSVGDTVKLYSNGPGVDNALLARIERVQVPPGLDMQSCGTHGGDCTDGDGDFADMAVIELSAAADVDAKLTGQQGTLAWHFPAEGKAGHKVGAGGHGGNSNPNGRLLQVSDTVDTDHSGGYFESEDDNSDGGDSGGPFYVNAYGDQQIIGVLWGHDTDDYDKYTSVPYRLEWILDAINFKWSGAQRQLDTSLSGATIDTVKGSLQKVQYACEKTPACEGYMYSPDLDTGWLMDNITGTSNASGLTSALKHGARAGNSGSEVGYVRSDGYNAIVHKVGGAVNELYKTTGSWSFGTISSDAPAAASFLSAYKRADGINAVVYRSTANRIIELALVGVQWRWNDLTNTPGAEIANGNPVAYVGADGASAVVYRTTSGRIHELRLGTRGWIATDLSAAAGATGLAANSNPNVFVRSDGYSSVVFAAGPGIYELYRAPGGAWALGGISNLAGASPAASRPFGYTHRDGTNAVVYRNTSNQIVEMWLDSTGWHSNALADNADGNPVAYVRTDGVESVLYRSGTEIMELTNTPWRTWNLSNTGIPAVAIDPNVFIRADGYNSVLTHDGNNDVVQLYWKRGSPNWDWNDLSDAVGE